MEHCRGLGLSIGEMNRSRIGWGIKNIYERLSSHPTVQASRLPALAPFSSPSSSRFSTEVTLFGLDNERHKGMCETGWGLSDNLNAISHKAMSKAQSHGSPFYE